MGKIHLEENEYLFLLRETQRLPLQFPNQATPGGM